MAHQPSVEGASAAIDPAVLVTRCNSDGPRPEPLRRGGLSAHGTRSSSSLGSGLNARCVRRCAETRRSANGASYSTARSVRRRDLRSDASPTAGDVGRAGCRAAARSAPAARVRGLASAAPSAEVVLEVDVLVGRPGDVGDPARGTPDACGTSAARRWQTASPRRPRARNPAGAVGRREQLQTTHMHGMFARLTEQEDVVDW